MSSNESIWDNFKGCSRLGQVSFSQYPQGSTHIYRLDICRARSLLPFVDQDTASIPFVRSKRRCDGTVTLRRHIEQGKGVPGSSREQPIARKTGSSLARGLPKL